MVAVAVCRTCTAGGIGRGKYTGAKYEIHRVGRLEARNVPRHSIVPYPSP